jgi:hypothetical protein
MLHFWNIFQHKKTTTIIAIYINGIHMFYKTKLGLETRDASRVSPSRLKNGGGDAIVVVVVDGSGVVVVLSTCHRASRTRSSLFVNCK